MGACRRVRMVLRSGLSLSRFLVDMPSLAQLSDATDAARARLEAEGIFAPLATARQYAQVYERLPSTAAVH